MITITETSCLVCGVCARARTYIHVTKKNGSVDLGHHTRGHTRYALGVTHMFLLRERDTAHTERTEQRVERSQRTRSTQTALRTPLSYLLVRIGYSLYSD